MNDGIPFLDIIIIGAVAAFLIFRLRSALGKRTGHEKRPGQDPFKPAQQEGDDDKIVHLPDRGKAPPSEAEPADETFDVGDVVLDNADADLNSTLTKIKLADRSFDPNEFINGARMAFEMIIAAFAAGDSKALRPLLANEVFDNFDQAIRDREENERNLETTLIGITDSQIIDADLQQKTAFVTVKFISEQVNVTRDKDGEVVEGDPSHVSRITDIWTFARNTRSRDPNWTLVATGSAN
ncbi:MAG: Tim44/TimA family putative adaptor protein [Pseudomonadota bacterium]